MERTVVSKKSGFLDLIVEDSKYTSGVQIVMVDEDGKVSGRVPVFEDEIDDLIIAMLEIR